MEFIISETDDILVSRAGWALAGALLQRTDLRRRLDALEVEGLTRPVLPHGDVLLSMIGLLCLGKSDYAAIEPFSAGELLRPGAGAGADGRGQR